MSEDAFGVCVRVRVRVTLLGLKRAQCHAQRHHDPHDPAVKLQQARRAAPTPPPAGGLKKPEAYATAARLRGTHTKLPPYHRRRATTTTTRSPAIITEIITSKAVIEYIRPAAAVLSSSLALALRSARSLALRSTQLSDCGCDARSALARCSVGWLAPPPPPTPTARTTNTPYAYTIHHTPQRRAGCGCGCVSVSTHAAG